MPRRPGGASAAPGPVYTEGDPATCFYVLLERHAGDVPPGRRRRRRDRTGRSSAACTRAPSGLPRGPGAADLQQPRCGSPSRPGSSCSTPTKFARHDAATGSRWRCTCWRGCSSGSRTPSGSVGQRERLLALGSLSAGLTHELNNPAAAAVRATAALRDRVAGMRHKLGMIATGPYDRAHAGGPDQAAGATPWSRWRRRRRSPRSRPPTARTRSADWLDDHGIDGGWELAPVFVQAGLDAAWLDQVAACVDADALDGAVRWLDYTVETELLMNEIEDSTTRISTLVGAAKQYSQMDRAPVPGRRRARAARQHPGHAGRQDRRRHHGGQGLRPRPAADPRLRRRAEPGLDEPDRQRGVRRWAGPAR